MSEERPPSDAARDDAARQRSAGQAPPDADAWAAACAEDLAAEKSRRGDRSAPPPGSAAEELRRFVDTVADRLSSWQGPLLGAVGGPAAAHAVRQVVEQARAAVEPVVERNPEIFGHLAAAGGELLAAYRSAVEAQERRWTGRATAPGDDPASPGKNRGDGPADRADRPGDRRDRGEGAGGGERIDLD
ncbi:DUF5304 family protein [Streptomyces sp. NPDC046985]|uniref:DUF5304 family protein n=1 Tax=Streptomyces sp. NPDC046985 TaxID=3155377 RepID=UPI0033DE7D7B